jgi:plastocyanin domain-containing protein
MASDKLAVLLSGLTAIAGIIWYFFLARRRVDVAVVGSTGVQESVITVRGGYEPAEIRVRSGQPVRLVFDRRETNPCSEELVLPDFQIRRFLPANQRTVVEFTPTAPGSHAFTCGMGMLHGKVIVS